MLGSVQCQTAFFDPFADNRQSMGPERSTKAVAAWLLALPISAALAMPAEAGGWGKGPSWKQARKIVTQAGKDIKNGWNDPVIGTVMFLGGVYAFCALVPGPACEVTITRSDAPAL